MIVCVDAAYSNNNAVACGVLFTSVSSETPESVHTAAIRDVAKYVPGSFYLRELPVILKVLESMNDAPDAVVVDGYVWLPGGKPGLGAHLYTRLSENCSVIGIAKNPFKGHTFHETVMRGRSRRPLYVTAAGMEAREAAEIVKQMAGRYRLPDMMRIADMTARKLIRTLSTD